MRLIAAVLFGFLFGIGLLSAVADKGFALLARRILRWT